VLSFIWLSRFAFWEKEPSEWWMVVQAPPPHLYVGSLPPSISECGYLETGL
jgi:hypothetical protein